MQKEKYARTPAWIIARYSRIWYLKKDSTFTFEWYLNNIEDDTKIGLVVISRLRKMGWIATEINPRDKRKSIYKLIRPEQIFNRMGREELIVNEN